MVDAAPAGMIELRVAETYPAETDGEVLVVVFDDPSVQVDQSVTVLYGALKPTGDTYGLQLAGPVDPDDPATRMEMSLAVSFGWQGWNQYSTVAVNGLPLTSAAGGQDDGFDANGGLITAGGVGDDPANPADPEALPTGPRSDDELYDLLPFVPAGARSVEVATNNPSLDDNVFMAVFEMNPPVVGVTYDGEPVPVDPDYQELRLGQTAQFTMQDFYSPSFVHNFKSQVVSGPSAGLDYGFECGGGCTWMVGPKSFWFTAAPDAAPGVDRIEVWDDEDDDGVRDAGEPYGVAEVRWLPAVHAVGMGDSYSSGEGVTPYDEGTDVPAWGWGERVRNRCHRSEFAYARNSQPPLYDGPLTSHVGGVTDTRVDFIACSGATTANVRFGGVRQYANEPPQLEQYKLSERTNLVTLSIGGNDVGFSQIIKTCAPLRNCVRNGSVDGQPLTEWMDGNLAALPGKLRPTLAAIRAEAPNATVVLMGYPRLFPTGTANRLCEDLVGYFRWDTMDWANELGDRLDAAMAAAAAEAGVHFVPVGDVFAGHEICGDDGPWLLSLAAPRGNDLLDRFQLYGAASFHPNKDGQLSGYAAALNRLLNGGDTGTGLTDAGLPANPEPASFRMAAAAAGEFTGAMTSVGDLHVAFNPDAARVRCLAGMEGLAVPAGGQMWLTGNGFAPGASVRVVADAAAGDEAAAPVTLGTVTADADGSIGQVFEVPAVGHGRYLRLTATGATPTGRQELLAVVLVALCAAGPDYRFDGFYAPVSNAPVVNRVKAGSAVPVKFSLGGDHGLDIFAAGSPSSKRVDCDSGAAVDDLEQTVTPGSSTLSYDPDTGRYQYVWKTRDRWAGTCRVLTVVLADGSSKAALFAFR